MYSSTGVTDEDADIYLLSATSFNVALVGGLFVALATLLGVFANATGFHVKGSGEVQRH